MNYLFYPLLFFISISGYTQGIGSTRDEIIEARGKDYNSYNTSCIVYKYMVDKEGDLLPYQVNFYFDADGICQKYVNYMPIFMLDETVKTLNRDYDMVSNTTWRDNSKSFTHSIQLDKKMFIYEVKFEALKDSTPANVPRKYESVQGSELRRPSVEK